MFGKSGIRKPTVTYTYTGRSISRSSGGRRGRKTVMDVIREVKVQLFNEIPLDRRDVIIKAAERAGAKVIKGERNGIIVDPDFFYDFVIEKLPKLPGKPEFTDEAERKLFEFLSNEALIYFDANDKKWKTVEDIL